jgi:hypothetical protein
MKEPPIKRPAVQARQEPAFFRKRGGQGYFGSRHTTEHFFPGKNATGESATAQVQMKCAACEQDEQIQKKPETDAKGNFTGNFIFDPGHDGLDGSFFNKVKKAVSTGTLGDNEIKALRADAIDRNGTVMQVEMLLMAAMRNPANVSQMQAYTHGTLIVPMNRISKTDEDYVADFGREGMPLDVIALEGRKILAILGISGEKPDDVDNLISGNAQDHILQYAGKQFEDQANKLIVSGPSNPEVPLTEILLAMLNGSSDSTPGDRVMAGTVYDIAKKANHPMAPKILSGALKVDALIPSVYQRVAGGEASYQYSADDKLKGDTIYIPTSIDTFNLADRALVIHELTHAADDFAATGAGQVDSLKLETHAYKEQGKYMMEEILALPVAERTGFLNTAADYTKKSKLYYMSMVAAAKDNVSRYETILVDINTHAPMSMTASAVKADLGLSAAVLENSVRTELLKYKDAKGKQLYKADTTTVDGPGGQYFHP